MSSCNEASVWLRVVQKGLPARPGFADSLPSGYIGVDGQVRDRRRLWRRCGSQYARPLRSYIAHGGVDNTIVLLDLMAIQLRPTVED